VTRISISDIDRESRKRAAFQEFAMPYLSPPSESVARAAIQEKLESISPGALPPGITKVVSVGGFPVEFVGNATCTSVIVRHGMYVLLRGTIRSIWGRSELKLGKTFKRGHWETSFGVQPSYYSAHSADPLPDRLVAQVRETVDGLEDAEHVLEKLKSAMGDIGEFVDCVRDRSSGVGAMFDVVFDGCEGTFLVALAVVLRLAGGRSDDVQCILDFVDKCGGESSAILSELLNTADRRERFENLMAIAPSEEQVNLLRRAMEQHTDVLGWMGRPFRDETTAREFYERLATALQRDGLRLAATDGSREPKVLSAFEQVATESRVSAS
jgi:hypothetical protein